MDALGINCGLGPVQMKGILADIMKSASVPVIVNPKRRTSEERRRKDRSMISMRIGCQDHGEIVEMGACVVGGCCGTTPEHIKKDH